MTLKIVLELSKAEKELLCRGLRALRREAEAGDSNLSKRQEGILCRKLLALESHIEDSWDSEVESYVNTV